MPPLLKTLSAFFFNKEDRLHVAYYVCEATLECTITKTGIPVSADGLIHLFGNLSCAYCQRDILEDKGIKCSILKIDISGIDENPVFDPTGEEASSRTFNPDELSHGYVITKPILPQNIIEILDYV